MSLLLTPRKPRHHLLAFFCSAPDRNSPGTVSTLGNGSSLLCVLFLDYGYPSSTGLPARGLILPEMEQYSPILMQGKPPEHVFSSEALLFWLRLQPGASLCLVHLACLGSSTCSLPHNAYMWQSP
jgi:hypothetical protein